MSWESGWQQMGKANNDKFITSCGLQKLKGRAQPSQLCYQNAVKLEFWKSDNFGEGQFSFISETFLPQAERGGEQENK